MWVDMLFPNEWQVHGAQRQVLAALYQAPSGAMSHADLIAITSPRAATDSQGVILRRHIHQLRTKLNRLGVVINSRRGEGYEMPAASREIIHRAIAERIKPPILARPAVQGEG